MMAAYHVFFFFFALTLQRGVNSDFVAIAQIALTAWILLLLQLPLQLLKFHLGRKISY